MPLTVPGPRRMACSALDKAWLLVASVADPCGRKPIKTLLSLNAVAARGQAVVLVAG